MSKRKPEELVKELDEMSDLDRRVFFEQAGAMCNTWSYTRALILETMFPSRSNRKHLESIEQCKSFVRDNGYLTRIHVLPDMPASTFRQCILKPLLSSEVVFDSGQKWRKDGKGQGHKVFRDKTRRYLKLLGQEEKPRVSRSIVKEPHASARQFVLQVLTNEKVLEVGFPKTPGFISNLQRLGYEDVDRESLVSWCEVVAEEVRSLIGEHPALSVYNIHNGTISIKTNTGVMKNE